MNCIANIYKVFQISIEYTKGSMILQIIINSIGRGEINYSSTCATKKFLVNNFVMQFQFHCLFHLEQYEQTSTISVLNRFTTLY